MSRPVALAAVKAWLFTPPVNVHIVRGTLAIFLNSFVGIDIIITIGS